MATADPTAAITVPDPTVGTTTATFTTTVDPGSSNASSSVTSDTALSASISDGGTSVTATVTPETTVTATVTPETTVTATVTPETTVTATVTPETTVTATVKPEITVSTKDLTLPTLTPFGVEEIHFYPWSNKPTVIASKEFGVLLAEQAALNFKRGIQGGIQSEFAFGFRHHVTSFEYDPNLTEENKVTRATINVKLKGKAEAVNLFEGVLSQHNTEQRLSINKLYKTMFGRSMAADINRELRGDLRDLSLALVAEPGYSDAVCLKEAMSGQFPIFTSPGTDEDVLIEILTSRTNKEILEVINAYKQMYDDDLDTAIKGDTSDRFELFLMSLLNASREEHGVKNEPLFETVLKDVLDLHTAASGEYIGMDFFYTFNRILCLRSFLHLQLVYEKYLADYQVNLETVIKALFDHDEHVKDGFLAIIRLSISQEDFFEEILFKAIVHQDEKSFIRVIRSRAEKDLAAILAKLKTKRAKSIDSVISSRRSASYRQLLTAITRDPSLTK